MAEHLTKETIDLFRHSRLSPDDLLAVSDHIAVCDACTSRVGENNLLQDQTTDFLTVIRGARYISHLTFEQLDGFINDRLDPQEGSMVAEHLSFCGECEREIRDLRSLSAAIRIDEHNLIPVETDLSWSDWVRSFFTVRSLSFVAASVVLVGFVTWLAILRGRDGFDQNQIATDPAEQGATITEAGNGSVGPSDTQSLTDPQTALNAENSNKDSDRLSQVLLTDGTRQVGINSVGELIGYEGLPNDLTRSVTEALRTGKVRMSNEVSELRSTQGVLMGDGADPGAPSLKLNGPVGEVVITTTPRLSWQRVEGAESYTVEVFDTTFNQVASSGPLLNTSWATPRLRRGTTYLWQVTATRGTEKIKGPQRPAPDAKYRIASHQDVNRIEKVKRLYPGNSLALGVAYAEAGLLRNALSEFELFARKNPNSPLPRRLISSTRDALGQKP